MSFKEITVNENILDNTSKNKIKKYDGISKNPEQIRALLIGQIGKNSYSMNKQVNLGFILDHIYSVLKKVQELIGGRLILLEAQDSPDLVRHYEKHGFEILQKENLVQMVKLLDFK